MQEMMIKELVEKSRKDLNAREELIQMYIKKYMYVMKRHEDIDNIEGKFSRIVRMIIEEYFEKDKQYDMCTQVNHKLKLIERHNAWEIKNFDEVKTPVLYLFKKAREGDKESKDKLIEKYMYIAEEAARRIESPYIESDDALQIAYLLLIKSINNCLENEKLLETGYISENIHHYIDSCYENKIKSMNANEEKYNNSRIMKDGTYDLKEEVFKQEFEDFINDCRLPEKTKLVLYKSVLEGKNQSNIAEELNVTRNRISQRLKSTEQKVKMFINIK